VAAPSATGRVEVGAGAVETADDVFSSRVVSWRVYLEYFRAASPWALPVILVTNALRRAISMVLDFYLATTVSQLGMWFASVAALLTPCNSDANVGHRHSYILRAELLKKLGVHLAADPAKSSQAIATDMTTFSIAFAGWAVLMSILYLANDYAMTAFFVRAAKRLFCRCVGPRRSKAMIIQGPDSILHAPPVNNNSQLGVCSMLQRVQGASMLFLESHSTGQLLNRFSFDVDITDIKISKDVCCLSLPSCCGQ
jgi:hypothetical protein